MKTIIAGSRSINDYDLLKQYLNNNCPWTITEVLSGTAKGVDQLGERWAAEQQLPVKRYKPDWRLGKQAGLLRNLEMIADAEALVALWDGVSRGTEHCINEAKKAGLKCVVLHVRSD